MRKISPRHRLPHPLNERYIPMKQAKGQEAFEKSDLDMNKQGYSAGAIMKRFFGMTPWKRTMLGCMTYTGVNLSTRKRYFNSLRNPQPFAGASSSTEKQ
jgi:hypothetical protein